MNIVKTSAQPLAYPPPVPATHNVAQPNQTTPTIPSIFVVGESEFDKPDPPLNRQWVSDAERALANGVRPPPPIVPPHAAFDVSKLTSLLTCSHLALRRRLYEVFKHPDFHFRPGESLAEERARTMRMWRHVYDQHLLENSISAGTSEGRARYDAVIDSCGLVSHSLDIKMSVHYGLFGATVMLMGDDEQARCWVPQIERCELPGCFSLTELGHGSNTRGIETVATYDVSTRQFVIHTPTESAQKYWIGGAGTSARWTVAFAQLVVRGEHHGIHPFFMRIRQEDGTPVEGVQIADCGHKLGMNGVDNGRLWFTHVRVPHEALLRKHSQVSLDGVYTTKFKSADERFGASLTSLSGGRISVAASALNQAKIGLTIAVRYALQRKAFGPPGKEETRLLDYTSHQLRLIPPLATTIVMQLVHNNLRQRWHNKQLGKNLHTWSSGFKALMSWHSLQTLQEAREACGGQGYKSENLIGPLRSSHDVALTYEGDNHILLQAVVKTMMPEFLRGVRNGNVFEGHFSYLNDHEKLRMDHLKQMEVGSLEFAKVAFRRREGALFAKLGEKLRKLTTGGMSGLDAFNAEVALVEDVARAHTELLFVELFGNTVREVRESGEKGVADMLELCGRLFAVTTMDKQAAFLRTGAVSVPMAEMARGEMVRLCHEVRPHVLDLVDAFDLPAHLLAPIAFDYVSHNSRARL